MVSWRFFQGIPQFCTFLLFMLQIAQIRKNADAIIERLKIRGIDAETIIGEVLLADENNRALRTQMEQLQANLNNISSQIGDLYKSGNKAEGDQ